VSETSGFDDPTAASKETVLPDEMFSVRAVVSESTALANEILPFALERLVSAPSMTASPKV
jgi:predicted small integral membrane protein